MCVALAIIITVLFLTFSSVEPFVLPFSSNPDDIHFMLHSLNGRGEEVVEELIYEDQTSLTFSSVKNDRPIVFLVHGFWSNKDSHFPSLIKNAYLETNPSDQNYIIVDWGHLSRSVYPESLDNLIYPVMYPLVILKSVPVVSERLANFIEFLVKANQTSLDRVHIVGHSLGAHISGYTGQLLGSRLHRITGLDPAGPFFEYAKIQRALQKSDATFLDVYHTSMGTRGDSSIDGHVDFYPNGGVAQPGCPQDKSSIPPVGDPFGLGTCSHRFATDIFAATIRKDFTACKCPPSFDNDEKLEQCLNACPEPILAGAKCPRTARGQYYFKTLDINYEMNQSTLSTKKHFEKK